MFVIAMIGLALGILNGISAGIYHATFGVDLQKLVSDLQAELNRNAQLKAKFQEAWNTRDIALANSLMRSSPVGKAYESLSREKALKKQVTDAFIKEINATDAVNNRTLSKWGTTQVDNFNQIGNAVNAAEFYGQEPKVKKLNVKNEKVKLKDLYGRDVETDTHSLLK